MTDTTADRASTLRRVQKLLAIAQDDRANPAEAAAAAQQAERIMRKFSIDNAEVLAQQMRAGSAAFATRQCSANMKRDDPRRPPLQRNPPWAQWIAVAVARLHDCQARNSHGEKGACLEFRGVEDDVQVAAWTFDFLVGSLIAGSRNFQRAGSRTKTESESYRRGFVQSLLSSLSKMLAEKAAEMRSTSSSTALVVVKAQAVAEHFGEVKYKTTKSAPVRDGQAYHSGRVDGSRVDVGRRAVGSSTSSPAFALR